MRSCKLKNPIASLSMYDWPETGPALDRLWKLIAENLGNSRVDAPVELNREDKVTDQWTNPELVVGQTCGWPYASSLRGKAIPFARFHYTLDECPAGHYQSIYIARSPDCVGLLASKEALLSADGIAMNGEDSQSGFHVFREITGEFSPDAIPEQNRQVTGSHRNSVRAVADGKAEIAAIDAISFELSRRYDAEYVDRVEIIGRSNPKPGLPLITSPENSAILPKLFDAVRDAVDRLPAEDRETLLIKGVVPANDADYDEFL